MANQETHTVEGLAYWAFLDEPRDNPFSNYEYDKKQWGVKLYVDKHNKALLESLNLTGKVGTDEEGDFYNFKLNYMTTSMKPMKPPKIVDADNKDITKTVRVGNGSKADLEFVLLNHLQMFLNCSNDVGLLSLLLVFQYNQGILAVKWLIEVADEVIVDK